MNTQAQPNPIDIELPSTGFMRVSQVLEVIPVGKTTWERWVNEGKAPKPVKLSERVTAWKVSDIRELIQKLGNNG